MAMRLLRDGGTALPARDAPIDGGRSASSGSWRVVKNMSHAAADYA